MPSPSLLSRLAGLLRSRAVSAAPGPPTSPSVPTLPYALPLAQRAATSRLTEAIHSHRGRRGLTGPGAGQMLQAQAIISRLARRAPSIGGIRAAMAPRVVKRIAGEGDAARVLRTPATVPTPAHLQAPTRAASELPDHLTQLLQVAEAARRQRESIEPLLERLGDGTATDAERIRLRGLVAQAMGLAALTMKADKKQDGEGQDAGRTHRDEEGPS